MIICCGPVHSLRITNQAGGKKRQKLNLRAYCNKYLLNYNFERERKLSKVSQTFGNTFPIEVNFQFDMGVEDGWLLS